jgi:hypothetical protein
VALLPESNVPVLAILAVLPMPDEKLYELTVCALAEKVNATITSITQMALSALKVADLKRLVVFFIVVLF